MKNKWAKVLPVSVVMLLILLMIMLVVDTMKLAIILIVLITFVIGLVNVIIFHRQMTIVARQKDEIATLKEKIATQKNEEAAMLSNASHEMRTPLTTIAGIAEGLQYGVISPEEQQHSYDMIKEEADRLTRLIKSTLSYERLRQKHIENKPEKFYILPVIERLMTQLMQQAEEVGDEIQNLIQDDICVYADLDQTEQILMNVFANAIQFTTNGIITVEVYQKDTQAHIVITDTGIGMTQDELSKIWQRYYKADPSRTKRGESGLGMAIVQQLVRVNQGDIQVSSKLGIGTKFDISLPTKAN